ncbi:MAG: alpha-glucosidase [Thermoplasmatales archaeon]|nr:alpha-glucosidase [Thermoplasmatales archaeon]
MPKDSNSKLPWWKKTVVYQIYPRSFFDSNEDGIGDITGIISKLDYLKELGIETIWVSPFFTSPQRDFGYDVSDFKGIDPQYGDMPLCDKLINETHKRDMKIVLDLVLNHTSDQHPWFIESRSSRDNPKRDWYIWKEGKSKNPPNNWLSMIGGPGWHYDEKTDQWYWAQFLPFQPDLNYRNPEVKETMFDVLRFWLRKKADGFRLDIIDAIYKDPRFRNNPLSIHYFPSDTSVKRFFRNCIYTLDYPDNFEFVKELRQVIDEFDNPPRFLVGEIYSDMETVRRYCGENADGLHSIFHFKTLRTPHNARKLRKLIEIYEKYLPEPYISTWVFTNHDRMRRITRLGNDINKAKLHAAFQLTVRGVPYIYYGEEIGMESPRMLQKESLDEMALKYKHIPQIAFDMIRKIGIESFNRDEQRTPMQWDTSPNAGFCLPAATSWLPVTPSFKERNVDCEMKNPDSLLNCYKRFLKARQKTPALNSGRIEILELKGAPKNVLTYVRTALVKEAEQKAYVFLNFGKKNISFRSPVKAAKFLVSTSVNSDPIQEGNIVIGPQDGIVLLK